MTTTVLPSLEELIESKKRLLPKGQESLTLAYIGNGEDETAPLQQELNQSLAERFPQGHYCFIPNRRQPCYPQESYERAVRRFHFKQAWAYNPFKGVRNAVFLNPPGALPLMVRASNPEIRVICAYTHPPRYLDAFHRICEEVDVVLLPKGIYVAAQLRNSMKKRVHVYESELAETIYTLCDGLLWNAYADASTQQLERIYLRDSHTHRKFCASLSVERSVNQALMVVDPYDGGLPALAGASNFEVMLQVIAPTVKALYVDAELLNRMPHALSTPHLPDALAVLMRESIRVETSIDYSEAVPSTAFSFPRRSL
jgi:hypothetical protein